MFSILYSLNISFHFHFFHSSRPDLTIFIGKVRNRMKAARDPSYHNEQNSQGIIFRKLSAANISTLKDCISSCKAMAEQK